jgi:hypothetical protein
MLPANTLWKKDEEKKTQRLAATRVILAQVFTKIKTHVTQTVDSPYIVYQVPSFVFGYPLYNLSEAVQYVKETLEEQGYQVWVVHPGDTLFISWIKPQKQQSGRQIATSRQPSYRPFVYDPASLQVLREKMDPNFH